MSIRLLQRMPRLITEGDCFTIKRKGFARYVDGYPTYDPEKTWKVVGSIQPITGDEVIQEDLADRFRDRVFIWTKADIKVNDTVLYDCNEYEVQSVEDWKPYRKARAVKKDVIA